MTELAQIGRYEPIIAIGTGGMATVYLARAPVADGVGREVALKVVHPHLRESEEAASTLIEEAKLAARIRHPNVVPVREVGEDGAGIFLVMDYVEGATLSKLARSGPVPLRIAARILKDALSGLHAAHELADDDGKPLELVHRDFSPQNVLVGVDGVTRLTDFGIARAATRSGVTSVGVVKGKVGYLSPEQALGKSLDRRSDVWAAGVVAWELVAARRLRGDDDEPVSTMMRIISEAPPRLSSVRPEISPLVEQAVAMALTLDPARRWPTAEEFSNALAEGLRAHDGIAEPDEVGAWVRGQVGDELEARREQYRRRAPAPERRSGAPMATPRRRTLALSLGAFGLALAAGVAAFAIANREPAPEPATAATAAAPTEISPVIALPAEPEPAAEIVSAAPAPAPKLPRARPAPAKKKPSLGPNPYRKP